MERKAKEDKMQQEQEASELKAKQEIEKVCEIFQINKCSVRILDRQKKCT
jgi:hypothetical protein